jgi:hypothetical protein
MVMLVTGGVELNHGPPENQGKTGQILAHVHNYEKENQVIECLLESHSLETEEL